MGEGRDPMATPLRRSPPQASCARCGAVFDRAQWDALAVVDRLGADTLQRMVLNWPRDAFVEIRRCTCGHTMARTDVQRRVRAA
jgi:hypothetical protein